MEVTEKSKPIRSATNIMIAMAVIVMIQLVIVELAVVQMKMKSSAKVN